jgi:carboxymethylenebutenolidase
MTEIEIRNDDEPNAPPMRGYLRTPERSERAPAIIVAHELFGVNADIRGVVDHLAEVGYVALAIEFYHRVATPGEALPRDEAGRKRGFEYLNQVTREHVFDDVSAAIEYLAPRTEVNGQVGMLGFSAGGHMAFLAASRLPLVATAILYGGWLTGGPVPIANPEPTIDCAPGIAAQHGKLLFAVGEKDSLIKAEQVAEIRRKLAAAKVEHDVVVYPEAEHAFFWEGSPAFHRAARDQAWQRVEQFFAEAFPKARR